jgi:hypothetical protein
MTDKNVCPHCGRSIQGTAFNICRICRAGTMPGGDDGPDGGPGVSVSVEGENKIEA